uniref:C2H2-type domain-containing protein n=1 Tax=Anser cygnoides TaxID=8845 RepID=A0A8B9EI46_ANSCY
MEQGDLEDSPQRGETEESTGTAWSCGCSKCGKTFNQKNNLSRHLRTHIGEHPYKCSECWRSFSDHSNLISHQKLHQGEKPYECLDCRKCFSQNTSLLAHHRIHTGKNPMSASAVGNASPRGKTSPCTRASTLGRDPTPARIALMAAYIRKIPSAVASPSRNQNLS